MNIEEIMTRNPETIRPDATVEEAVEIMMEKNIRHLPITEDEQLVGMISDRDVRDVALGAAIARGDIKAFKAQAAQPVSGIMSGGVVSVATGSSVPEVAQLMLEEAVGALPVVEAHSETLVGMVSYVDILRYVAQDDD